LIVIATVSVTLNYSKLLIEHWDIERMKIQTISASETLNEAYDYEKPSAFSRGLIVEVSSPVKLIYISGTASINEEGNSIHVGDFRAQALRSFENITLLLRSARATWKDIVKTTIYLKDIKKDYEAFNEVRCNFYKEQGLSMYPSSVCVQAHLCREELLVEIEAQAIVKQK